MEMECSDEEYIDYNFKLKIINFYQDILELEDFGFSISKEKEKHQKCIPEGYRWSPFGFPHAFSGKNAGYR